MAKTSNTSRWRGRHVFDSVVAKKFEGGIGSPGRGNTFYVDGVSGSDGNNGRYASSPLLTIAAALALCTTENDDYIMVMDCWQEGATITVNKALVHIIGINSPQAPWTCLNVATDIDVFTLGNTGNMVEIAGFNLGGGSTKAGINMGRTTGAWIHHNAFGHLYAGDTPLYGISAIVGNPALALIEENTFYGDRGNAKGTISSNGIYQYESGDGTGFINSIIRRNVFMGLTGATIPGAITLCGAGGAQILDNIFFVPDEANGEAINLISTYVCHGCIISGNRAANGMLSNGYTYNPFRDLNTNTLNAWALNYQGNAIVEPVGA